MKVQISAVITTYNEERNIGRCLESLQGVVDEIVVVDSYSSDRTEEICQSFKLVFIKHRFQGHVEQKNWAVLQASSPYILSIGANEALSEELKDSIMRIKENWAHDGYFFNRLTFYCGHLIRHSSWYPSGKLSLWDSRKGSWGGLNPNVKYILEKGSSAIRLKGDLLHYSYNSMDEHLLQISSNSSVMAQSYFDLGRRVSFLGIVFRPLWRFLKDFIILRGFMDGFYGYIASKNSAYEVFLKFVKLRNLYREKSPEKETICFFNTNTEWGGGEKWHHEIISCMNRKEHRIIYISSPSSPLAKKLDDLGVAGYQISIKNLSFLNPVKLVKLKQIFRKESVGVLITNLPSDMKVASIAARRAGVPNIIYRRGSALPVRNNILNRYLFKKVLSNIVANSQETRRTILAENPTLVHEKEVKVIYSGISLAGFHQDVRPLYQAEEGEIVLGCAGRLSEEKEHLHLIEMMKLLQSDSLKFKLLLAGEGKMLHTLEKRARKLGVSEQIIFLKFVKDMPAFYRSIDIFLLPSRYEGLANVIAEAMASWKPVVAFDIRSSAEIVKHGETGYLIRPNQVDEMTARVQELARDKELRVLMGDRGRARVEEYFSLEKNYLSYLQLFLGQAE